MIIAKEGILYPAGYGSRCWLLPGEREHSEREDLAAKINHQRQPEKNNTGRRLRHRREQAVSRPRQDPVYRILRLLRGTGGEIL